MSGGKQDIPVNRPQTLGQELNQSEPIRFPTDGIMLSIPREGCEPRLLRVAPITPQDLKAPVPPNVMSSNDPWKAALMFEPDPRRLYCQITDVETNRTVGRITFALASSQEGRKVVFIDNCDFDRSMDKDLEPAGVQLLDGLKTVARANDALAVVKAANDTPQTNRALVAEAIRYSDRNQE